MTEVFDLNNRENGIAFIEMQMNRGIRFGEEDQELSLGHIESEIPIHHPSGNAKEVNEFR